ncbi:hypothetical protein ACWEOZ_13915 [Actinoplanes sp. NPDC004185]
MLATGAAGRRDRAGVVAEAVAGLLSGVGTTVAAAAVRRAGVRPGMGCRAGVAGAEGMAVGTGYRGHRTARPTRLPAGAATGGEASDLVGRGVAPASGTGLLRRGIPGAGGTRLVRGRVTRTTGTELVRRGMAAPDRGIRLVGPGPPTPGYEARLVPAGHEARLVPTRRETRLVRLSGIGRTTAGILVPGSTARGRHRTSRQRPGRSRRRHSSSTTTTSRLASSRGHGGTTTTSRWPTLGGRHNSTTTTSSRPTSNGRHSGTATTGSRPTNSGRHSSTTTAGRRHSGRSGRPRRGGRAGPARR